MIINGVEYISGLSREPDADRLVHHLYRGTLHDPGYPMCLKGWNRDDHTSYSIWRESYGASVCKVCMRRALEGREPVPPKRERNEYGLRVYRAWYKDEEWGCAVVARSVQQAKVMFHHENPAAHDNEYNYTEIRAKWLRDEAPLPLMKEPGFFDTCTHDTCDWWGYGEHCASCQMGAYKRERLGVEDFPDE